MDEFLDNLWLLILAGVGHAADFLDAVLAPLHVLGPSIVILILTLFTVCFTKLFGRVYTTRRYRELKEEFTHWFNLRQEALQCEDREKGKLLAKNIDQARLNKVYYDYFFEGLLKNILTTYLPVLIMAAYVNETYQPDQLMTNFGRDYIFKFNTGSGDPVIVGGLFWFIVTLLSTYLTWFVIGKMAAGKKKHG
jgi:hypothetical protein